MNHEEFHHALSACTKQIEPLLAHYLSGNDKRWSRTPQKLMDAMRYGVLNGGKRLRPFLLIESARLFGQNQQAAHHVGAALECIHAYSLIHDDLPAMDDDDLRRGQPTVHRAFDEATAILAGDSLLTLAFEIVAESAACVPGSMVAPIVATLAKAAGGNGMVGGQVRDLFGSASSDETDIILTQAMKTGALIEFAATIGAMIGGGDNQDQQCLAAFGKHLGLAYQIADDLLDVTGHAEIVGKATGKDKKAGKQTFVSLFGEAGARSKLEQLQAEAVDLLDTYGSKADTLKQLMQYSILRQS